MADPTSDSNETLRFYMAMFGGLHSGRARRLALCPDPGGATLGGRPDEGQPFMPYDPFKRHRRSIRLKGYDYSQAGAYFITICAQNREGLFGEIDEGGEMQLNDAGKMIVRWWDELSNKFPTFEPDAFVVMPNHIHCIVVITDAGTTDAETINVGATLGGRPDADDQPHDTGQPRRVAPTRPTLGDIMDRFKTMATNEHIRGVKQLEWKPFNRRVFQRNYYEHIIRNEWESDTIRAYIQNNPANWAADLDNLKNARRLPPAKIVDDYLRDIGIM